MKWQRILGTITLVGVLVPILCGTARADDSSLGAVGSSVEPLQNDQVTMAAERVDAVIRGDQAWVTCVFTFTNSGSPANVLMGFPQLAARAGRGAPELLDFRSEVDGKAVPVTFKAQAKPESEEESAEVRYAGWHTFNVSFKTNETRAVRNTYHGRLSLISNGDRVFSYVLHTGATWRGPIGQADVTMRWLRDRDVLPGTINANPPGYQAGNHQLHWHFTNLEPTQDNDIYAYFRPVYGADAGWDVASASSGQVTSEQPKGGSQTLLFADDNPATAWLSSNETSGAWITWWTSPSYRTNTPTTGLGILPGVAGDETVFRAHGRPRQVLVRLALLRPGADLPPGLFDNTDIFEHPPAQLEITDHQITVQDSRRWQYLTLAQSVNAVGFKVIVQSVYPGNRYNDVAISEVLFPLLRDDVGSQPSDMPGTGVGQPADVILGLLVAGAIAILAGLLLSAKFHRFPKQS